MQCTVVTVADISLLVWKLKVNDFVGVNRNKADGTDKQK
jgi:hypothetical protein